MNEHEKELRRWGCVWHAPKGWYLPHPGSGLPLRAEDRLLIEKAPFGTFLAKDDQDAVRALKSLGWFD